jgi:hypothetical protein
MGKSSGFAFECLFVCMVFIIFQKEAKAKLTMVNYYLGVTYLKFVEPFSR